MKQKKICFISSCGGHFAELKSLKPLADKYNCFLVTEKVKNFSSDFCKKVYFVAEYNRKERLFLVKFAFLFIRQFFIFLKERPSVVVTTGALTCYPMVKIAKFFKKKIVYIESYARVDDLSKTGKMLYKSADLFLVQWKELADKYDKAVYAGSVFGGQQ